MGDKINYLILDLANPSSYKSEEIKFVEATSPPPVHTLALEASEDIGALFRKGDIVYIQKTDRTYTGELLALVVNGQPCIKKVYFDDDSIRLVSLSDNYEDKIIRRFSDVQLIGKVVL